MLIYIAAPLSNEAEREFNVKLASFVRQLGFQTYLPQEDGGVLSDFVKSGESEESARARLFSLDCEFVRKCDILLAVLDGRTIDEGVCFELGLGYALGKVLLGFKTDSRSSIRGRDNLMIEGSLLLITRTWQELSSKLHDLKLDSQEALR
jgi:nucleoside 2-deoxyribosyltransferase